MSFADREGLGCDAIADDVNALARFLGRRDVERLAPEDLERRYGLRQADAMALFGGSILAGGDVLAEAIRAGVARTYFIVGGAGHTTETFRLRVRDLFPDLSFADDAPEADVFAAYLAQRHGLSVDHLERASTNCGNNITYLLRQFETEGMDVRSLILSQDATMQRRMGAELELEAPDITPICFATYAVDAVGDESSAVGFSVADPPLGMWEPERYLSLLMGEIPRLTDDERGYGPKGAGHLVHVDVPAPVRAAFEELREAFPDSVRVANPRFGSADDSRHHRK